MKTINGIQIRVVATTNQDGQAQADGTVPSRFVAYQGPARQYKSKNQAWYRRCVIEILQNGTWVKVNAHTHMYPVINDETGLPEIDKETGKEKRAFPKSADLEGKIFNTQARANTLDSKGNTFFSFRPFLETEGVNINEGLSSLGVEDADVKTSAFRELEAALIDDNEEGTEEPKTKGEQ